jgi:hypothetical protein
MASMLRMLAAWRLQSNEVVALVRARSHILCAHVYVW